MREREEGRGEEEEERRNDKRQGGGGEGDQDRQQQHRDTVRERGIKRKKLSCNERERDGAERKMLKEREGRQETEREDHMTRGAGGKRHKLSQLNTNIRLIISPGAGASD